ncbi:tRNA (adenosine(37)-N6)-threonylcarbamoyltransferase complex transferase subunit TsaD [Nitratireductor kimnyeongensis]|uniref:tRNA N6-adenosine threonylcarbamoyltransferase n=1 Tax=Nitratireductor kimnyeongensis TaxID=430679 RepID=A0ABW0TAN2_9HYPH|nr:tRNA (adenosine(37)-N6)-threonylcarbamoyltransferase complex transferase subunit TsaD [Nitratireductor kimnyeongensis]QZZ36611.1 tRNA (adenosine(37)-N6)-threonylcarbamoyltransferase complex transferase subunit TsaD [Nitratireductor kimnyeongensis]
MTRILGIETSCDETAAAVIERSGEKTEILSNVVLSQIADHAAFGGVVPEIAARAHVEALDGVVKAALDEAGLALDEIDAIAATAGPGLIGGLIVGLTTAKAIAAASGKALVPVNHLEGHALTARLTDRIDFPYLLLLVSGGHTQIVHVEGVGRYQRWASTIDDALGEAFDKTAKLLGLPYPGGPSVEKAAADGDPKRFAFPRPLKGEARPDFSFSGLKTAVRREATSLAPLSDTDIADICASFQKAVTETLSDRVARSLARFRQTHPVLETPALVVAGGVAANQAIRAALDALCENAGFRLIAPPLRLCGDNAAMIAWAGLERLEAGLEEDEAMGFAPRPRWPLDQASAPLFGAGKRGAKA